MKKTLLLTLLLLPIVLMAQSGNFQIKGKVGNYNAPAKVFLTYKLAGENKTDSSAVKNGEFIFIGTIKEPVAASLILDYQGKGLTNLFIDAENQDVLTLYLEKGTIRVEGADSLHKAQISGSPTFEDIRVLRQRLEPLQEKIMALNKQWESASKEQQKSAEFLVPLQKKWEEVEKEKKSVLQKFIQDHPDSYASLDALKGLAGSSPEYADVEPSFKILSPQLQQTDYGKYIAKFLQANKGTAIGAVAMDFTQNDPNGKPVKLSDFRGKYVLLDFWASWCGPCRQENPNVVRVFNKFKDKNFTVLGVSLDRENGKKAWLKAIENDRLTWTHVSDLKFWNNEVAMMYGIQSIPQNFLLDPEGKIIAKNLRGEELDQKLSELLK